MMTTTRNRVPDRTAGEINRRIQRQIDESILYYDRHRDQIPGRLRELSEEWDIERAIEANASLLGFAGVALVLTGRNRLWLALPALVSGFLFQHAVEGWCPPIPILRRLGFRTSYEIEQERLALKVVRGDFDRISDMDNKPEVALRVAADNSSVTRAVQPEQRKEPESSAQSIANGANRPSRRRPQQASASPVQRSKRAPRASHGRSE